MSTATAPRLITLAVIVATASLNQGQTTTKIILQDNFNQPALWSASSTPGFSVATASSGVTFNQGAGFGNGSASLTTVATVSGDFTAQVDASRALLSTIAEAGLSTTIPGTDIFFVGNVGQINGNLYVGCKFSYQSTMTTAESVRFQISRSGETLTQSFDAGNGFVTLFSRSDPSYAQPTQIRLFEQMEYGNTSASQISFANFTLSTPFSTTQPTPVRPGYSVSLVVSGLSGPSAIVYRPATHDLLVCEHDGNKVSRVDVLASLVSPFTSVALPEHIAVDSVGNVYVTTANTGGPITVWNSTGQAVASFLVPGYPTGLALDANNNLYLGNNVTDAIYKYAAGSFTNPTTFGSGFRSVRGITFDTSGRLFAEDYVAGIVYYVTSQGNTVWATGLGSNNEALLHIAYDQFRGSLLVAGYTGVVSEIPSIGVVNPFATGFSVPDGIAVDDRQNIYVADYGSGNVWKFSPVPPPFTITAVSNAASSQSGPVSPGEIVTITGTNIGPTAPASLTLDQNGNVSSSIGGVQALFSGIPAPLTYASSSQINAVVPYGIIGLVNPSLQINFQGQLSNTFALQSAPTVPALFTLNASGTGPGAILNQNGTVNSAANPAAKGSYIVLYATGEGQTAPPGVTGKITTVSPTPPLTPQPLLSVGVAIGGQSAAVAFYGEAPGIVSGVLQINAQIPATVTSGNLAVQVSIGGTSSQSGVTVSVQ